MLFVEKKRLIIILIFSFLLILASAIWAYNIGTLNGIKSDSELILFLGFIFAGVQLILSIILLFNAKKKHKDFLALMEIIKSGGIISDKKAKKIGSAGIKIKEALAVAHEITSKKSLKIASLNGLLNTMVNLIQEPVLVINLTGEILAVSAAAKTKISIAPDLNLSDCFPQLSVKDAFKEASSSHLPVEQEGKIVFFPVFSTIGDISYFLVDLSKEAALSKFIKNTNNSENDNLEEADKKQKKNFWGLLKD